MSGPIIVTAGLPYANGSIHIGHLVEYVMTDIYVRALRLAGEDARYICADDTHGTPIEVSASKAGVPPEEFVARFAREHIEDFTAFGIQFDSYYSTNSPENRNWVLEIYEKLRDGGHLTRRPLEQFYDLKAERFLPDRFIKGTCPKCGAKDQYGDACESCNSTYQPTDLIEPYSVLTETKPVLRTSEHVFVDLARFTGVLSEWVESEGHLQPEIRNWVKDWLKGGLKDWCISRDAPYFGFEIPDMPGKFFYVWLDAPIGYISSTENWAKNIAHQPELLDLVWRRKQGRIVHVIGKDIVYFHTLFWPAMLHAAGLALPDRVHVHGFLTVGGVKMSKSRGTFINAKTVRKHLDPIYFRYYLASKIGPNPDDIDLVLDEFIERVNADLVGKLVNLVARAAPFIANKLGGHYGRLPPEAAPHLDEVKQRAQDAIRHYQGFDSSGGVRMAVEIARIGNKIFQESEPWALARKDEAKARDVVTLCLNIARSAAVVLAPALPAFAAKIYPMLGLDGVPKRFDEAWAFDLVEKPIGKPDRIFDRVERAMLDAVIEDSKQPGADDQAARAKAASEPASSEAVASSGRGGSETPAPVNKAAPAHKAASANKAAPANKAPPKGSSGNEMLPEVDIETFGRIDLRVGLIQKAEVVEGADKLLKLTIDLGEEKPRTVFAGIRQAYAPEQVEGSKVAVVANLAPRKMRFGISEGMVLAAGPGGKDLWLPTLPVDAVPGAKIS